MSGKTPPPIRTIHRNLLMSSLGYLHHTAPITPANFWVLKLNIFIRFTSAMTCLNKIGESKLVCVQCIFALMQPSRQSSWSCKMSCTTHSSHGCLRQCSLGGMHKDPSCPQSMSPWPHLRCAPHAAGLTHPTKPPNTTSTYLTSRSR